MIDQNEELYQDYRQARLDFLRAHENMTLVWHRLNDASNCYYMRPDPMLEAAFLEPKHRQTIAAMPTADEAISAAENRYDQLCKLVAAYERLPDGKIPNGSPWPINEAGNTPVVFSKNRLR